MDCMHYMDSSILHHAEYIHCMRGIHYVLYITSDTVHTLHMAVSHRLIMCLAGREKFPWPGWARPGWARPGQARPSPTRPCLTEGLRMRGGANLHENQFFIEKYVWDLFWWFLGLLNLKNGSSSKFYAGKWHREAWKLKFKPFHEISVKCYKKP